MNTLDSVSSLQIVAAVLFAVALLHTFSASLFARLAHRSPRHAGLWHLLGEVEVVFGFWAIVLVIVMALMAGGATALEYAESRQFTEPLFVFVVMVITASRPVLQSVFRITEALARLLPMRQPVAMTWLGLGIVPLLGSVVTEPAAMTIAALLLAPLVFRPGIPERWKYLALGVLFVNVSIGGTLTSFAAPPVLMVAKTWNWDSAFMLATFGWKAALAVLVNATGAVLVLRPHLRSPAENGAANERPPVPPVLAALHFLFLAAIVATAHHPVIFLGIFLMFLGVAHAYERHQSRLILREALLVGFFLAGLVVLGGMQRWWLGPLLTRMPADVLFFGATLLTAVTDNAALTYLGSLIEGLSPASQYALVAGAVAGGGLTVIANAPNPAGAALVRQGFADESIGALRLLGGAALPTAVAILAFTLL